MPDNALLSTLLFSFALALPGVPATRSPAAAQTTGDAGELAAPTLRLGMPGDEVAFFRIRTVAVAPNGRLWVLDAGARVLRVFGPDGRPERTIGRQGRGPGEFESPAGLALAPGGGAVVFDSRLERFTFFDSDGTVVRTQPVGLSGFRYGWTERLARLPSGTFVAEARTGCGFPRRPHHDGRLRLLHVNSAGEVVDSVISTNRRDRLSYYGDLNGSGYCFPVRAPYPHLFLWDMAPDGRLATADGGAYVVQIQDMYSRSVRSIETKVQPRPLTRAHRDRYRDDLLRPELPPAELRFLEGFLEEVEYPTTLPVIDVLRFDERGRLWVRRTPGTSPAARWDAYDGEGRALGSLRLPGELDVHAITSAGFAGVVMEPATDVQYVVLYPIPARFLD